ncbi:MAG: hypothetical protein IPK19_39455 [Chloroflexi bacterium]|nr:hypothetical protein [Chloroflexota bacterium]
MISGNGGDGIFITGSHDSPGGSNVIQGNYIGLKADGTGAVPPGASGHNNEDGIKIMYQGGNPSNTLIGGTTAAARNVISGATENGIWDEGGIGTVVQGNYIGTNAIGSSAVPNKNGIRSGENPIQIGGTTAGAGNVISGNTLYGVTSCSLSCSEDSALTIQGNIIGLNADGSATLGNGESGIYSTVPAVIGGTVPGAGNLISGNRSFGINVLDSSTIQGNRIGVRADGVTSAGNYFPNIFVGSNQPVTISGNIIANSIQGAGVYDAHSTVSARGNSIYGNYDLGIDILDFGVRANIPGSALNYPVISSALVAATNYVVNGTLNSQPNALGVLLDFYASRNCDSSGYGEGELHLGTTVVNTSAAGVANFAGLIFPRTSERRYITATATYLGKTSEFSACYEIPYSTGATLIDTVTLPGPEGDQLARVRIVSAATGTVLYDWNVTLDASGTFIVHWIPPGTYHVWIKSPRTLSSSEVSLNLSGSVSETTVLRGGNANDDTIVNISDFSILAAAFGTVPDGGAWDARADFNRDNVVNISDFSILAANFGQTDSTQGAP